MEALVAVGRDVRLDALGVDDPAVREASALDLEKLEELCEMVACTSLCGLGQNAPNPVRSTLRYFRNEYLDLLGNGYNGQAAAGAETAKSH